MDKKVLYALIGGAAIVGAAIIFSMSKGESQVDDILDKLGPVEREENGKLEFEYFLKIFKECTIYGKREFGERKKELIALRRQALKDNDEKKYEEIVVKMT